MRTKLQNLPIFITFNSLPSFTASKVGEMERGEAEHFGWLGGKLLSVQRTSWFQDFLGFYFNVTPETMPPWFLFSFLSLCWMLREPSDVISKPRICPSKITGENAINFLLPCFQEQTSLMLFLRFF